MVMYISKKSKAVRHPSFTYQPDPVRVAAWRKPLDASYRGLRTALRRSVPRSSDIELWDTDCTVVLTIDVADDFQVWVTSPTAWKEVGDCDRWTVELYNVAWATCYASESRKSRDDEWIVKTVQKMIRKGRIEAEKQAAQIAAEFGL